MSGGEWRLVKERVEEIATEVVEWNQTWNVIYGLHQRDLLTKDNVTFLRDLNTRKEQIRQLVGLLAVAGGGDDGGGGGGVTYNSSSSSSSTLSAFLEVLVEQGMGNLVRLIDPTGAHSPDALSPETSAFSTLRLTPYHLPSPQSMDEQMIPTFPAHQPLPPLPLPGQDILNNNDKEDISCTDNNATNTFSDDCTAAAATPDVPLLSPNGHSDTPRIPLSINVVPCREIGGKQFRSNKIYKNESEPRGYVFLANYKDFADNVYDPRLGSEIDVSNLGQLFSQMGYRVSYHINMTKWGTIQALRDFRNMEEHNKVDSCVVVFMSHGRDDRSFYTSDNQYLLVHDVVERFNNRDCPLLKGKPKIFIFQFCRGSGPDQGVDAAPRRVSHSRGMSVEVDSSSFGETLVEKDPTFTDMYIIYSTVGGFVSFRHPESGSWLVEAICKVFMRDACDTELEHLMKDVSQQVRANSSTDGNKQACEYVLRAFDRHFFFNPKPLASLSSINLKALGDSLPQVPSIIHAVRHRRRIRTSSPAATHKSREEGGARSRHFSGESDKGIDDMDVLDHPQLGAQALHPRIKNLGVSQRRMSEPESSSQPHGVMCGRSFSQLNSESLSSESSESLELGATGYSSKENLPAWLSSEQQWNKRGLATPKAYRRDAKELYPDTLMGPSDSMQEAFPLSHSQSALEPIRPSELGGVTGVGPELRASEAGRVSFKRQLSVPSNNETLEKVNDVRRYLQVNEVDETLLQPLKRIESFINKKKREGKRRKVNEPSSLEY